MLILFIAKPDLLATDELLLLYHQMYNHPHKSNMEGSYEIIYIPIPSPSGWSDSEERNYNFVSNLLPWCSIRKPRSLSSTVVKFIKQEWDFRDDPIGVVIDTRGLVTNLNAMDMMKIWGSGAYPFSASREEELWDDEKSTFLLMFNTIDPLLAYQV